MRVDFAHNLLIGHGYPQQAQSALDSLASRGACPRALIALARHLGAALFSLQGRRSTQLRTLIWVAAPIAVTLLAGCGSDSSPTRDTPASPPPPTPGVTVSPTSLTVAEGDEATYTVVLDSQPAGNVTVTPASGEVDAATVSGAVTFTTGNWNAAQTVTVTGVEDDNADASDESVTVTHAVSGYGSVTTAASVAVTVDDNDLSASGIFISVKEPDQVQGVMVGLMLDVIGALFAELIDATAELELDQLDTVLGLLEQIVVGVIQDEEPEELERLLDSLLDALSDLEDVSPDELQTLRGAFEELIPELDATIDELSAEFSDLLDELGRQLGEVYGVRMSGLGELRPIGIVVLDGGRILGIDISAGSLFGSTVKVEGADISGEVQRTLLSGRMLPSTFSGTVVAQESIQLVFTDDNGDETALQLAYNEIHERPSSLASWEGTWVATENGESVSSMTVDGEGALLRQDADGCTASGNFSILDAERNLYGAQIDVSLCGEDDGRHAGFAFLGDAASGGENNRGVLFVVRDGDDPEFWMSEEYSRQ